MCGRSMYATASAYAPASGITETEAVTVTKSDAGREAVPAASPVPLSGIDAADGLTGSTVSRSTRGQTPTTAPASRMGSGISSITDNG